MNNAFLSTVYFKGRVHLLLFRLMQYCVIVSQSKSTSGILYICNRRMPEDNHNNNNVVCIVRQKHAFYKYTCTTSDLQYVILKVFLNCKHFLMLPMSSSSATLRISIPRNKKNSYNDSYN